MTTDPDRLLARFAGARPPAPAWYDAAIADRPETGRTDVEGALIAWRAWGPPGAPGLLLVHGGWAHAGWWSHVAPLLATDRRVAALSLSGMGGSGRRGDYGIAQYARELRAVASAAGLDAAGPPVVVGHSFGCAPTVAALADRDGWAGGGILIDGSITMKPGERPSATGRHRRPFATPEAALARYRLLPAQPCDNPFIVDGIAREFVVRTEAGWEWAFDPLLFDRCTPIDTRALLKTVTVPVAFIRGGRSAVVTPDGLASLRADVPALRVVTIHDAGHHVMLDQPLALVAAIDALLA